MARLDIANLQPEHRQVVKPREAELSGLVSFVRRRSRDQAVRIEAGARREREAQAVCIRQGARIMRQGHGLLD